MLSNGHVEMCELVITVAKLPFSTQDSKNCSETYVGESPLLGKFPLKLRNETRTNKFLVFPSMRRGPQGGALVKILIGMLVSYFWV